VAAAVGGGVAGGGGAAGGGAGFEHAPSAMEATATANDRKVCMESPGKKVRPDCRRDLERTKETGMFACVDTRGSVIGSRGE